MAMNRNEFLASLGNLAEMETQAAGMEEQRKQIWSTIKGEFFTSAGKPRAKAPAAWALEKQKQADKLLTAQYALQKKIKYLKQLQEDPHCHIRKHGPALCEVFGLPWECSYCGYHGYDHGPGSHECIQSMKRQLDELKAKLAERERVA
jgi:hypothetical protein